MGYNESILNYKIFVLEVSRNISNYTGVISTSGRNLSSGALDSKDFSSKTRRNDTDLYSYKYQTKDTYENRKFNGR